MPSFLEFFAGGGMVRAGLGPDWTCLLANDIDPKKGEAYAANWGPESLRIGDIAGLTAADAPDQADLAWGSFPCQDLSLAGLQAGLAGRRSGAFFAFWDLMSALIAEGRGPRIIALENVVGTLSSRRGADFAAIGEALTRAGYQWGAIIIDAVLFTPQSRPRLFIVGARGDMPVEPALVAQGPADPFHPRILRETVAGLRTDGAEAHVWWRLPPPVPRRRTFADVIENRPPDVPWHSQAETARLLEMMAPAHRARVEAARRSGELKVGSVYRRTRPSPDGGREQRAEVRFDGVAGCLRTPGGGSSRQTILVVDGPVVRSRLLSAREAARLMGLADDYRLPQRYTQAYHLAGDGVAPPVVRHLAEHLFEPLLRPGLRERHAA